MLLAALLSAFSPVHSFMGAVVESTNKNAYQQLTSQRAFVCINRKFVYMCVALTGFASHYLNTSPKFMALFFFH
jgi:hypothetical protein